MKEFLGFGGYSRTPEGFLSWQHLSFVSGLMVLMVVLALFLGKQHKGLSDKEKSKPLIAAALLMDGLEIFKILILCLRNGSARPCLANLPLFLCSIQLISIPLAAFSKGRIREAALDFVCIFGMLGAILGTYGAGQNYNAYPVLSLDNVVSGLTHAISGFAALYIFAAGLASMKKENIGITFGILGVFCVLAFCANCFLDTNYMFLVRGDGTPYDVLYNLVGGDQILYPLGVVGLFVLYIALFYQVYFLSRKKKAVTAGL